MYNTIFQLFGNNLITRKCVARRLFFYFYSVSLNSGSWLARCLSTRWCRVKPWRLGQVSCSSKCMCLSVNWLVVTEVIGFVWGGGWLQSVKCQVCFQWDCASGPLCWSLTRFVFLRENGRVNDGRLYQMSLSRLSFDGIVCILLSCVVSMRWSVKLCMSPKSRNT